MSKPASEHSEFAHSPTQDDLEEDEEFTFSLFVMGNIFALCFLVLAGAWSSTVPSSAIPFIAQRFPNEAGQAAWIAAAPSVMGAILQAIIGDLSDIFGRRAFLQAGCVVGTVGMIIGGRATSIKMLIGGQVLNGLGNASMFLASALAQEIVPKRQRPLLLAAITTVTSVSYICGPILEGVCIKQKVGGILEGWRIGFYIGAALWAITLAFITTLYHPMPRPNPEGLSIMQLLRKVDWLGIALCSTGVTLFLVGLNYGGNPYSWDSAVVLGTLIPGLVVSLCFVLWEWKGTKTGLMHHDLFVDRNYVLTVYVRVVGGIALLGGQAYLPQVAASVFETDGLTTAVWQLPMTVSSMIGSVIAAFFLKKFKEARWIITPLILTLMLGAGLMLIIKPGISFAAWFFPAAMIGITVGGEASLMTVLSSYFVPNHLIATGVCVANAATLLGGAVAVTIYSVVFNSKIKKALPLKLSESVLQVGLPESSLADFLVAYTTGNPALANVPGVTPVVLSAARAAKKVAYADSFRYIWYILLAFAGICLVPALLFSPTAKYMTNEVAAPVQERRAKAGGAKATSEVKETSED